MDIVTKSCRVCKQEKPLSSFYSRKDSHDGYRNDCKSCNNATNVTNAEKNKDRIREYKRLYHQRKYAGTDKQKEKQERWNKDYYVRNRDVMLKRAAVYRNSEEGKENIKNYRRLPQVKEKQRKRARMRYKTPEGRKYRQSWKQTNRDKVNESTQRRRAKIRGNGGEYTRSQWETLIFMANGECLACGSTSRITVDHIVPVSKGGSSYIDNIQPLCYSCNSSKQNNIADYRPLRIVEWATNQVRSFG